MLNVSTESIGAAHLEAVKKVCRLGVHDITEDGEHVVKLEEPLCIHVGDPLHEYSKFVKSPYGAKFDAVYEGKVVSITPRNHDGLDPTYTYGNRIRDYLRPEIVAGNPPTYNLVGDGDIPEDLHPLGYDQLEVCIEKLQHNPSTRRAIMCTWIPWLDHESEEPPCIVAVDLKINSDNKLTLVAFIRSNDILMAWGENAIGLVTIQQFVAKRLGIRTGYLETISRDAHVYFKRDQTDLRTMGVMYDR